MENSHRMFLQAFMSRGILDAKDVIKLFQLVCDRCNEPVPESADERKRRLAELVITINTAIKQFSLEIRKGVSEDNGANYYCLINIQESPITRMASDYTPNELEFFKKIVGSIVASETGTIGSTDALNLTNQLGKKMSKEAAQDMLRRMIRDNWMTLVDGQYGMATRALLELEQYIREQYPNLATLCNLCKKLCLQCQTCEQCNTKLHRACAARFFNQKKDVRCPGINCNAVWEDYNNQDSPGSTPASSSTRETRKRKAKT
ncbi:non-structural maintenance of chromosomes element 1 homolog [Liolophura sinensis]|uniref:non-structural maintenance of chromosomes element 1 homolog n=1 Tax=Liolophura sinensis TaxID=3198878 RepID=UPI0031596F62